MDNLPFFFGPNRNKTTVLNCIVFLFLLCVGIKSHAIKTAQTRIDNVKTKTGLPDKSKKANYTHTREK